MLFSLKLATNMLLIMYTFLSITKVYQKYVNQINLNRTAISVGNDPFDNKISHKIENHS